MFKAEPRGLQAALPSFTIRPGHISYAGGEGATKVCNRACITQGFPCVSWTSVPRI